MHISYYSGPAVSIIFVVNFFFISRVTTKYDELSVKTHSRYSADCNHMSGSLKSSLWVWFYTLRYVWFAISSHDCCRCLGYFVFLRTHITWIIISPVTKFFSFLRLFQAVLCIAIFGVIPFQIVVSTRVEHKVKTILYLTY